MRPGPTVRCSLAGLIAVFRPCCTRLVGLMRPPGDGRVATYGELRERSVGGDTQYNDARTRETEHSARVNFPPQSGGLASLDNAIEPVHDDAGGPIRDVASLPDELASSEASTSGMTCNRMNITCDRRSEA
jgi:hypothetical protein